MAIALNYANSAPLVLVRRRTPDGAPAPVSTPAPAPVQPVAAAQSPLDAALAQCAKLGPPAYYIRKICEEAARKKYAAPAPVAAPTPTVTVTPTVPLKSAEQQECERKGGIWTRSGCTGLPTSEVGQRPAIVAPIIPQPETQQVTATGTPETPAPAVAPTPSPTPAPAAEGSGPSPAGGGPAPAAAPGAPEPTSSGLPVLPLVLAAAGALILGVALWLALRD